MHVTHDIEAKILSLGATASSVRSIEAQTGVSRSTITALLKKNGHVTADIWSDAHGAERAAFLIDAWPQKHKWPSISRIAQELTRKFGRKVNKSQLIGKARRLGLPQRADGKQRKITPRPAFQNGFAKSMTPAVQAERAASIPPNFSSSLRLDPMPDDGITFEQLTTGMCKWPLGHVRDEVKFFCGEKAEGNYCTRHHAVSVSVNPVRRRTFLKEAA